MRGITPLQRQELKDLFKPYKKAAIIITIVAIIQAILQSIILLQMKPLLDSSIKSSNLDSIYATGAIVLILIVLHGACAIFVSRKSAKITADMAEKTRLELFRRVVMTDDVDPSKDTSGMMIRLMTDIDNVQRMVTDFLRIWLYTLFLTIGLIVVSFIIDFNMGMAFLISTLIVYSIIIYAARVEFGYRREIIDKLEKVIRSFRGYVKGARNRRYLGCLESDHEKFSAVSSDYSRSCDDTRIRAYKRSSLARLLFIASICGLLFASHFITGRTQLNLADLTLFIEMALLLETSLSLYPFLIESIPIAAASMGKINDALNYRIGKEGSRPEHADSKYIIRSADERYPSIVRGQETSIITLTDSGAWDFVQTVTGTKNTEKNTLYIEEQDITQIDHRYITKKIAYAGPRALTMDGTLYENIDIWRGIDEERIKEVCASLSIDKPLDFEIQRASSNISSGESFRISVARALVSDADIYIFENSLMLVDNATRKQIVRYIRTALKGKTVIFISHNAPVSEGSDNIVMVSEGKVICNDTKDNVMASNPLYRELYRARRCSSEGE